MKAAEIYICRFAALFVVTAASRLFSIFAAAFGLGGFVFRGLCFGGIVSVGGLFSVCFASRVCFAGRVCFADARGRFLVAVFFCGCVFWFELLFRVEWW